MENSNGHTEWLVYTDGWSYYYDRLDIDITHDIVEYASFQSLARKLKLPKREK